MPTQVEYGTLKKVDKKEVKYLGRDFPSIRQNLLEFAKAYFPNSYNDFNESSPGMMFIEMTAYVGDVLGFYIDNQYRESLLHAAEEKKNIFKIAQSFGYKPKLSSPSIAIGEFSIEVPATLDGGEYVPNTNYALSIDADSKFSSKNGTEFRLLDSVNFKTSSSLDERKDVISNYSGVNPTHFRITKKGILESGNKKEETFTFGSAEKFDKVILGEENVIHIESISDSDGNTWYEVPFLAQDTVFESIENNSVNSPDVS